MKHGQGLIKEKKHSYPINYVRTSVVWANEAGHSITEQTRHQQASACKRHSKDACRVSATTWTHINSTYNIYLVACFPWRNKACPFLLISSHVTAYACQIPWMLENRKGPGGNGRKRDKWRSTATGSRRFETLSVRVLTWDWGYVKLFFRNFLEWSCKIKIIIG